MQRATHTAHERESGRARRAKRALRRGAIGRARGATSAPWEADIYSTYIRIYLLDIYAYIFDIYMLATVREVLAFLPGRLRAGNWLREPPANERA